MNFTCTYTQTEELLRNYYFKVKMRHVTKWLGLGIVMILGSIAIFIWTREELDLLFLVLGLGLGLKEMIAPRQAAKKDYQALVSKYGEAIPETVVELDEKQVVATFDGAQTTLLLEDVLGLHFFKDFMVLHGYSQDVILTNVEDPEACQKFLQAHCKNAPVYKR